LTENLPCQCRRSVIVHELAHLRRRDHWVGWLLLTGECICWWNPLFWYVRRQIRLNAELACDAWVVGTLPDDRRAYAEALLEVTQLVSQTAAPMPALGMSSGARQAFERRLTMIMRERVPCRVPVHGLIAIGFLGILALPGWSQVEVRVQKGEDVKKKQAETAKDRVKKVLKEDLRDGTLDVTARLVPDSEDVIAVLVDDKKPTGSTEADREKRIQALEKQIQALLKEVRALRGSEGNKAPLGVRIEAVPLGETVHRIEAQPQIRARVLRNEPINADAKDRDVIINNLAPPKAVHALTLTTDSERGGKEGRRERFIIATADVNAGDQVVELRRATYKLPQGKAEILAKLLRELVKAQVLETRVEGETLTVTTTPGAQKAIHALVDLIQGKSSAAKDLPSSGRIQLRLDGPKEGKRVEAFELRLEEPKDSRVIKPPVEAFELRLEEPKDGRVIKPLELKEHRIVITDRKDDAKRKLSEVIKQLQKEGRAEEANKLADVLRQLGKD
jgi:hypothetical protein